MNTPNPFPHTVGASPANTPELPAAKQEPLQPCAEHLSNREKAIVSAKLELRDAEQDMAKLHKYMESGSTNLAWAYADFVRLHMVAFIKTLEAEQ